MSAIPCGLDFGTSNSTLGIVGADGAPHLVPLENGKTTLPSVVFFSFEDGQTYFGREALSEYVTGADGRIMRALKSVLGTSLMNDKTRVRAKLLAFTDIIGLFLARLRRHSEELVGNALESVVVGRPVRFVDDDDKADAEAQAQLETAVRQQGFRHIAFQYEPIAAALDYERHVSREELAIVIDIGGGTSDFTVIRLSPERAKVAERQSDILATTGVHIGGTDFDRLLSMAKIMPHLGHRTLTKDGKRPLPPAPYYDLATWHRINRLYNQKTILELKETRYEARRPELVDRLIGIIEDRAGHRLGAEVEAAKIALSDSEASDFRFQWASGTLTERITRMELDVAIAAAVQRVQQQIATTLAEAGTDAAHVETVILTGGSTQIPAIMAALHQSFPQARFVQNDAFGSVGLGLALDASRRF